MIQFWDFDLPKKEIIKGQKAMILGDLVLLLSFCAIFLYSYAHAVYIGAPTTGFKNWKGKKSCKVMFHQLCL